MGDILGGVFGGGKSGEVQQKPDALTKALNELKYGELEQLFAQSGLADFAKPKPGLYTPSKRTSQLINEFTKPSNVMTLQDYLDLGLTQGKNYISQVATPQIMSAANLQGLEGGGFVPESIAKATAEIGLPFVTSLPGFLSSQQQQAQGMVGMADLPRQLREQDYLRRQGVVTTGFTGLPYTPGMQQKSYEGSMPLFNFFGFGGKQV